MLGSTVAFAANSSPAKVDVSSATVTNLTYTKKAQTPQITVNGQVLTSDDYTVTSGTLTNTDAGTYKVTIAGTGKYEGTATLTYKIAAAKVDVNATIANQTYNKKSQTAKINVKTVNGTPLTQGTDYTVTGATNKDAGTYTVTIKGKGNWSFTETATYKILPAQVEVVASVANQKYTGKSQTAAVKVKTANGTALTKGTDYTVSGAVNKNAGTYTVTIKGTGNWSFTKSVKYKIAKLTPSIKLAVNNSTKRFAYSGVKESAKVTVTTNNSKVKVSGKNVVIGKGVKKGTKVTITVKVAATTNYNAVTKKIVYVVK
jgi:hypothetical protein